MKKNTILIITGATATGKTELAIKCANLFGGEIISADSMQIYRSLDIGTAKPSNEELNLAKHHMVNIVEPNEEFSVQQFVDRAEKIIDNLFESNKLPIIVGGTGLYIKSLIYPYSFCGTGKNEEIRNKYKQILEENGKEYLYNLLMQKDADSCKKIHMNDTKRVIRALEICDISGSEKTKLNKEDLDSENKLKAKYNCIFIVLNIPRDELYSRINLRVEKMFSARLLEEVENLVKNNIVNENSQSMQAIGYKEFFKFFSNEISLQELKELISKNSRNYAKRQITFMKSFKDAVWFNPLLQQEEILCYIEKELK